MSTTTREISNSDDIIDSRDVIARIEYLEGEVEGDNATEEDQAELKALKALAEEGEQYAPDWTFGEGLIRNSYFTEYAEQLAEGIGTIDRNASWPLSFIDWGAAAEALKQDYTSVDFDGVEYWMRS